MLSSLVELPAFNRDAMGSIPIAPTLNIMISERFFRIFFLIMLPLPIILQAFNNFFINLDVPEIQRAEELKHCAALYKKPKIALLGASIGSCKQPHLDVKNSCTISYYLTGKELVDHTKHALRALYVYIDFFSYYKSKNIPFNNQESGVLYVRIPTSVFYLNTSIQFLNYLHDCPEVNLHESPTKLVEKLDKLGIKIVIISNFQPTQNKWIENFVKSCLEYDMLVIIDIGIMRAHVEETFLPECFAMSRVTFSDKKRGQGRGYIICVGTVDDLDANDGTVGMYADVKYAKYFYYTLADPDICAFQGVSASVIGAMCANIWALEPHLTIERVIEKLNSYARARTIFNSSIIA